MFERFIDTGSARERKEAWTWELFMKSQLNQDEVELSRMKAVLDAAFEEGADV